LAIGDKQLKGTFDPKNLAEVFANGGGSIAINF
jgi:hypothetical protein